MDDCFVLKKLYPSHFLPCVTTAKQNMVVLLALGQPSPGLPGSALPGLLLDTVNVPHDTRVVHHNNEWPDTLAFNSQLFEAVPLQFQVVI